MQLADNTHTHSSHNDYQQEYERRAREHNDSIADQSSDDDNDDKREGNDADELPRRSIGTVRDEEAEERDEEEVEVPLRRRRNARRAVTDAEQHMDVDEEAAEDIQRDSDGTGSRTSVDELPTRPEAVRNESEEEDVEMADVDEDVDEPITIGSTWERPTRNKQPISIADDDDDMWSRPSTSKTGKTPSQPVSIMQDSDLEEEDDTRRDQWGGMGGGLDPSLEWRASDDTSMANASDRIELDIAQVTASPVKSIASPIAKDREPIEKIDNTPAPATAATKKRKKYDVLRDIGFDFGSSSD